MLKFIVALLLGCLQFTPILRNLYFFPAFCKGWKTFWCFSKPNSAYWMIFIGSPSTAINREKWKFPFTGACSAKRCECNGTRLERLNQIIYLDTVYWTYTKRDTCLFTVFTDCRLLDKKKRAREVTWLLRRQGGITRWVIALKKWKISLSMCHINVVIRHNTLLFDGIFQSR